MDVQDAPNKGRLELSNPRGRLEPGMYAVRRDRNNRRIRDYRAD
jgi:hypothetical protein